MSRCSWHHAIIFKNLLGRNHGGAWRTLVRSRQLSKFRLGKFLWGSLSLLAWCLALPAFHWGKGSSRTWILRGQHIKLNRTLSFLFRGSISFKINLFANNWCQTQNCFSNIEKNCQRIKIVGLFWYSQKTINLKTIWLIFHVENSMWKGNQKIIQKKVRFFH